MSDQILTESTAGQLVIGDQVAGDGPYAEFQGGEVVEIGPHPDIPGALRVVFKYEAPSSQQGWCVIRKSYAPDPESPVSVRRPIAANEI